MTAADRCEYPSLVDSSDSPSVFSCLLLSLFLCFRACFAVSGDGLAKLLLVSDPWVKVKGRAGDAKVRVGAGTTLAAASSRALLSLFIEGATGGAAAAGRPVKRAGATASTILSSSASDSTTLSLADSAPA